MDDTPEEPKKESEKIEIDWKEKYLKAKKFSVKYGILLVLLLVIILQVMPNSEGKLPWGGLQMRMLTKELPSTDKWAKSNVEEFYKNEIKKVVAKEYPNLPDINKKEVLTDKWAEFQKNNKEEIQKQTEATKKELLKHFQYTYEGKQYLYLPDIDPYYYFRKTRNLIETGTPCDEVKDGIPWDNHMAAPFGQACGGNSHAYVLFGIYKINKLFDSKIDLLQSAAKFSPIIIFLSIILAYFIGLKLAGKTAGFFSALMIGILPSIFTRTPWGHADTDAYNTFFPLLALFTLFMALDAKKIKNKIIWAIITGLVFVAYSYFWSGWWFMFDVILGGLGVWIIVEIIKAYKKKNYKNLPKIIAPVASFFLTTLIIMSLLKGINYFFGFITNPLSRTAMKDAAKSTLWPNVFTTVAELNKGSWSKIIASMGGNLLFLIALIGVVLALWLKDEKGQRNLKLAAILTFWFIFSIYASFKGVRFMLLLAPAFAIAFGVGAGLITKKLSEFGQNNLGISKKIGAIILILLFGVMIATSGIAKKSYKSSVNDIPIVNDAWYNSLNYIKENSQKDAIINSWWDYGHHFKYFADRAVTFDGASQNTPMAHWIGRVLVTEEEDEAIGILRMLDCGSNKAFEIIDEQFNDAPKSVSILYKIFKLDKEEAKQVLEDEGVDAEEVTKYTHCEAPENFFITSGDMLGKAGVWAHFGLWDFMKADMWMNMRKLSKLDFEKKVMEKYQLTEKEAETYYNKLQSVTDEKEANNWISPWPGFPTRPASCSREENELSCGSGLKIDLNKNEASVETAQGKGIPHSLIYFDANKEMVEIKQEKSNMDLSVILIPKSNLNYNAILLSKELARSMFTRLYFLEGHGLKHFEKVYSDRELTQGDLYVWKVDWQGQQNNLLSIMKPKTEVKKGNKIAINYIGWLENGTIFDSSIIDWKEKDITTDANFDAYETKPLTLPAGTGQLIKGFDEALIGMKPGEEKTVNIPPEKAYGTDPDAHFLGNKTLNFKIKIEKIL